MNKLYHIFKTFFLAHRLYYLETIITDSLDRQRQEMTKSIENSNY